MDKKQIQKSLTTFTNRVKQQFKPKQIVLFGSYARGEISDYSDIDIVVVAEAFKSTPFEKRLDVLYTLTQDLYPDFHVFGYTPQEFEKLSSFATIAEAKTEGIPLI